MAHQSELIEKDIQAYLHAQESACSLYRRAGFHIQGEPFMEAGIRHITMEMSLDDDNN